MDSWHDSWLQPRSALELLYRTVLYYQQGFLRIPHGWAIDVCT